MEKQQYEELLKIYAAIKQVYQNRQTLNLYNILLLTKVELIALYNSFDPTTQAEEPPPPPDDPLPPPEKQ